MLKPFLRGHMKLCPIHNCEGDKAAFGQKSEEWLCLPFFPSPSRTSIPISFLSFLLQPEMKKDIYLFKTFPYSSININKYMTLSPTLVYCAASSYNTELRLSLSNGLWMYGSHFPHIFSILLPICMTYRPYENPAHISQTLEEEAFQSSSKLPTNQQLAETCTKSDHLEMGSWFILLELSSPLQQHFWVKNSSKHMNSRPEHFSCFLCSSPKWTGHGTP